MGTNEEGHKGTDDIDDQIDGKLLGHRGGRGEQRHASGLAGQVAEGQRGYNHDDK